jgi:hypothetical protein
VDLDPRRIVEVNNPGILMIQESMGGCESFIPKLVKLFPGGNLLGWVDLMRGRVHPSSLILLS